MFSPRLRRLWRRRLRRRPLLPWLLAGTVVGNSFLCVLTWPLGYTLTDVGEPFKQFSLGSCLSQLALLAVWLMSSRAGFPIRLLLAFLGSCLVGQIYGPLLDGNPYFGFATCVVIFVYFCVGVWLAVLCRKLQAGLQTLPEGISLVASPRSQPIAPALWRRRGWRISTLLLWTTTAAVVTAVLVSIGWRTIVEIIAVLGVPVILLVTLAAVSVVNEAARGFRRWRSVFWSAITAWLLGAFLHWRSGFPPGFASAVLYTGVVVAVAFAWCAGLRGRRPAPHAA